MSTPAILWQGAKRGQAGRRLGLAVAGQQRQRGLGRSKQARGRRRAPAASVRLSRSEAVADLVGPEALEAREGLVEALEVVVRDTADRLDRLAVLVVERLDDLVHLLALLGQADA